MILWKCTLPYRYYIEDVSQHFKYFIACIAIRYLVATISFALVMFVCYFYVHGINRIATNFIWRAWFNIKFSVEQQQFIFIGIRLYCKLLLYICISWWLWNMLLISVICTDKYEIILWKYEWLVFYLGTIAYIYLVLSFHSTVLWPGFVHTCIQKW